MREYGMGTTMAPTAATGAAAIGAGGLEVYQWVAPQGMTFIGNNPNSGATLYIRVNSDTAGLTDWDFIVTPGQQAQLPGMIAGDIFVRKYAIYADVAVTYGDDFVVKGWE